MTFEHRMSFLSGSVQFSRVQLCATPWIAAHQASNTLATSCGELTHWKRPWCWEGLRAGGEGDDRGWDGWMASLTQCMWVWVNSGSWWWTGRPGVLRFMESHRAGHDWTELNLIKKTFCVRKSFKTQSRMAVHTNSLMCIPVVINLTFSRDSRN